MKKKKKRTKKEKEKLSKMLRQDLRGLSNAEIDKIIEKYDRIVKFGVCPKCGEKTLYCECKK